jgi:hypothetical protein
VEVSIYNNNGLIEEVRCAIGQESAFIVIALSPGNSSSDYTASQIYAPSPSYVIAISDRIIGNQIALQDYVKASSLKTLDEYKEQYEKLRKSSGFIEITLTPETDAERHVFRPGSFNSFDRGGRQINWYHVGLDVSDIKPLWKDIKPPTKQELENWIK